MMIIKIVLVKCEKGEQIKITMIEKRISDQCTHIRRVQIEQERMGSGCGLPCALHSNWREEAVSKTDEE